MPAIARFVKRKLNKFESYQALLRYLGQEMYGNDTVEKLNVIHSSIVSYESNSSEYPENPTEAFLYHHHLFTHNVLNQSPFSFSLVFFDLRQNDMPSYFNLSASMFQRQAGIVLMHSSTPDAKLPVYTRLNHSQSYTKIFVPSVKPKFNIPTLDELYSDDPSFDDDRFKLLKWTLSFESKYLKAFDFQNYPDNYLLDSLTITFMLKQGIISLKEADLFIWTIKNVENRTIPDGLEPPAILDPRAFRLAFLYVRLFSNVARSIEVCGLKKRYWVIPAIIL